MDGGFCVVYGQVYVLVGVCGDVDFFWQCCVGDYVGCFFVIVCLLFDVVIFGVWVLWW